MHLWWICLLEKVLLMFFDQSMANRGSLGPGGVGVLVVVVPKSASKGKMVVGESGCSSCPAFLSAGVLGTIFD